MKPSGSSQTLAHGLSKERALNHDTHQELLEMLAIKSDDRKEERLGEEQ